MGGESDAESAAEEILERSTAYFEERLWESEVGSRARMLLCRSGFSEATLRLFRVGYAPGDTRELLDHLGRWSYSASDLIASGIASRSERSRLHVLFHARIMFPIGDREDRVLGFAGLATHLGPSWPLWLTSPDQASFDAGTAIFALSEAESAIRMRGRALVLRDPVQVLALHEQGRREAVGVIHSPITRAHLAQLAEALHIDAGDLHLARRDGRLGVAVVGNGTEVGEDAFALREIPAGFTLTESGRRADSVELRQPSRQAELDEPPPTRPVVYVVGAFVGIGIPVGLLLLVDPHNEATRGAVPTLNAVIIGVAVAYLLLALGVARISARARARSRTRRMREPWARGSGEWQPTGWTYHRLEEVLVGAALASAVTCIVLLMTIGGFLG